MWKRVPRRENGKKATGSRGKKVIGSKLIMRTHGCKLFDDIKDPFLFAVLGFIGHVGLFWQIGHPLLRERSSDDVLRQVSCGLFFAGLNSRLAPLRPDTLNAAKRKSTHSDPR